MGSEMSFPYLAAVALALVGFWGILGANTPGRKALAWCLLQGGAWVLVLSFSQGGVAHPLGEVLGWMVLGVGLITALALFALGRSQPAATASPKRKER